MPEFRRPSQIARRFHKIIRRWIVLFCLGAAVAGTAAAPEPPRGNFDELLRQLPPLQRHEGPDARRTALASAGTAYEAFLREKLSGNWFAAFVPDSQGSFEIVRRFESWKRFMDFLQEHDAIVDVWAYGEDGAARRVPALEVARLKRARLEQPTFLTVIHRAESGAVTTNRVEFGFNAAQTALSANESYLRQRKLQQVAREILSARDADGKLTAQSQWDRLSLAVLGGELSITHFPAKAGNPNDLFVAFEWELDDFANYAGVANIYRESELQHKVTKAPDGTYAQLLLLKKPLEKAPREAWGYKRLAAGGSLVPAPNPVQGQEAIELRVKDPAQADVEKWNVVEFGEPELIRQSALAKFSLISAHLERSRKQLALKMSTFALIVEPIFFGLNVGGGITGVGVPLGEAARLAYNTTVVPRLIPDVPTAKQLRDLLLLLAAREKHPEIKTKPERYLDERDLQTLRETASQLSEKDLADYVERVSDDDLKAMVALARMQRIDMQVSNLLSIMANIGKVWGVTESGILKDIFQNPYFSVTGDISIKNLFAVAVGGKVATPLSGVSLEQLAHGEGPAAAWLQFLDFTVDIRAIMNTIHRLTHPSLADKELKKPFPYSPRMTDLAAYEIRIFGYPLLIWYKRGLLKNDIASFDNDYAYGLFGATIVEHFRTKEDMDAEIRAGAMVPLGYVLIPDKEVGWRESNLAVFAHRIRSGKNKGQTAIIIYGLKAYRENSEFIEREYKRLKQFEQALAEGGVIERTINAPGAKGLAADAFEPKVHTGSNVVNEVYAPLLANLSEWHRVLRRWSWALPFSAEEAKRAGELRRELQVQGVATEDADDPLVSVDRQSSTFIYRAQANGKSRLVQLTSVPGLADIQRDLAKAEDAASIETVRRESIANGEPVALMSSAEAFGGKYEIGPLLRDPSGKTIGVRSGSNAIEQTFTAINQLPVSDRARLELNNYASTLLDLDADGDGKSEKVFLTIEFPPAGEMVRVATNVLTGEVEQIRLDRGSWKSTITARRITELERNDRQEEIGSRTFVNIGTLAQPRPGALLEETRTLEIWPRNHARPIDPYQPTIRKLRLNYITGEILYETYGLFSSPIETVDSQYIAQNKYDAFGNPVSSSVFENGKADADFERPLPARLQQSILGEERFRLTAVRAPIGEGRGDDVYQTMVEQKDLAKGSSKTLVFDRSKFGRKAAERFIDPFDGTQSFQVETELQYRDDFFYGLIPAATIQRGANSQEISRTVTKIFDPSSRRLVAEETDYTGALMTKLWDARWEDAIQVETQLRRTTNSFDRRGLSFQSTTFGKISGEKLSSAAGRFDPAQNRWMVAREFLRRPGIVDRTETESRSAFGRLISARLGPTLQLHPIYGSSGTVQTNELRFSTSPGTFDKVVRRESDFFWIGGGRRARVDSFADGKLHASLYAVNDAEGRTITKSIRTVGRMELVTTNIYDGDSDRVLKSEQYLNGTLRATWIPHAEQQDANGQWVLPVEMIPAWGLVATQMFVMGDSLARAEKTIYENGRVARVAEWFEGTSVPRVTETLDRRGAVIERAVTVANSQINDSTTPQLSDSTTPDRVDRFRVGHWGTTGLLSREVLLPETDIVLFSDAGNERTYFEPEKPFRSPRYSVDLLGRGGAFVSFGQTAHSNVVTVFRSEAILPSAGNTNFQYSEPVLVLHSIDLRSLFFHKFTQTARDRAGNILDEWIGHAPYSSENRFREETLFSRSLTPGRRFHYAYEPGWLAEEKDPTSGVRNWRFTSVRPAGAGVPVNESREFVSSIEGIQAVSEEAIKTTAVSNYLFRRIDSPRELDGNPYMPGRSNVWTAWTASEMRPTGDVLFNSEMVYDAHGRLCVSRASKKTSDGAPAMKLAYNLHPFGEPDYGPALPDHVLNNGRALLTLSRTNGAAPFDLSSADFVYFVVGTPAGTGSNLSLVVTDAAARTVEASEAPSDFARRRVQFWELNRSFTRWLPNTSIPRQGITLDAEPMEGDRRLAAISTHDLARAGLDLHKISSFDLRFDQSVAGPIKASPVYELARNGPWLTDHNHIEYKREREDHSSGITTFTASERMRTVREIYAGQRMTASAEYNGLPVAAAYAPFTTWDFPFLIVLDHSDSEAPRPLYAVSPKDGHFLEHYKMVKLGDAQVYTVVRGFDLPHLDVFRANILDDELAPGYVAYGDDYQIALEYARGRNLLSKAAAGLQNRVAANAFRYLGQRLLRGFPTDVAAERLSYFNYESIHDAHVQAREINELPTLAETLLPSRALPWEGPQQPISARGSTNAISWTQVRFDLAKLHSEYPATGLIPTAVGARVDRYVETAREADLIVLAFKLSEIGVARELLQFYWEKSQGGQQPLHSFYDAESGTTMRADVMYERPMHARRTAVAQLAVADAAFQVGIALNDSQWLTMGRNLLTLVFDSFRPPAVTNGAPRGISEFQAMTGGSLRVEAGKSVPAPFRRSYGLAFWPEADVYSLESNARAYLLLREIADLMPRFVDPEWRLEIGDALKEQERWLRMYVLPQVEREGVVPSGVFQIQDVHSDATALASERWTSAEDWLFFLQAAQRMGIPAGTLRTWLDNLAKVHGVQVSSFWGLDWQAPLLRRDVISPELTAQFWQTARILAYKEAESFASNALAGFRVATNSQSGALGAGAHYPVIITEQAPTRPLPTGSGSTIFPSTGQQSWSESLLVYKHLRVEPGWDTSQAPAIMRTKRVEEVWTPQRTDRAVFAILAVGFYLSILVVAIFWWRFRALRRAEHAKIVPESLVAEPLMELAEERWAKRILGVQNPANSEHTRYSNAPLEQNFLMQLRAIYKLVLEWRRQENGWAEDDRRIVEDESDDWLNGADEFVSLIGLYMRWVIKAGAKDGFNKKDMLLENEDSNHIWSRLVMYLAEYYWGLVSLMRSYNNFVLRPDKESLNPEMARMLSQMGLRQRPEPFDARQLFNFPADPTAMDMLVIQKPGMTLDRLVSEMSIRLRTPYTHIVHVIERYKHFKRREAPYPIHPYAIEFAKLVPHFLIMGLGAMVWYNQNIGDSPIIDYLWLIISKAALSPMSLLWAIPIFLGFISNAVASAVRVYRFDAPMFMREKAEMILDATLTSLFAKGHSTMPKLRKGHQWNPRIYERISWSLRAVGFLVLAIALLRLDTPSFGTFMVVKGLFAMLAIAEVAAVVLPLIFTVMSKGLQDLVTAYPKCPRIVHALNKLNITAVRPASPIALSFHYHFQPSVPSGNFASMTQSVVFYFLLAAVFFMVGAYLCQQIFSLWFTDTYLTASNWKLFFGGLLFWNTMFLLRYGLFVFFTGMASAFVTFPLRAPFGLLAGSTLLVALISPQMRSEVVSYPTLTYGLLALGLIGVFFEEPIVRWFKRQHAKSFSRSPAEPLNRIDSTTAEAATVKPPVLGVVYMSGDDLSHLKLTPDLLMTRWGLLKDKLASSGIGLLERIGRVPDEATLRAYFDQLYQAEKRSQVTLWIPSQLVVRNQSPAFRAELGLNIEIDSEQDRENLLVTWHIRRWLVSMMSTAGHSQDTAVNLVDMVLRLETEGLGANTVFYLIQNKYDNNDNNRPSQIAYDQGELAHRNKLARLFTELAPGSRAYSLQNWTPFGFKAGGLMAMDLAHEETLNLRTMVVLDRNATVHDLDAFMRDLHIALSDPDLVIIVPGRSTTNTLTSVGQGSQMVEEGHRSFLKGVMGLLGGGASESVGTGWGNIIGATYGRVQSALLDAHSYKMPITSRMWRGSSFAVRTEGLIGFAPHAVGISEDTWAVSQTAHNLIGLGRRVKYRVSEAIWHKIRETWSHSEWLASFPRWSGGYLQMMHDPLMQRINDLGSKSIFSKEIRANSGRNFLMAPFALLNIMTMPLAIMLDLTPFVQILLVLWNFGFVMNQILTIHALNTYLEGSGFYRIPAAVGAVLGGLLCLSFPGWPVLAPPMILLGAITGGFAVGLSRWLYTRVRDLVLFGPQLVLHALGQVFRQSLEFVVSGASPEDARSVNMAFRTWVGPREDRPLDRYSSSMNLKTVIWIFGMASLVLNLFALLNLDLLNVLLLLPSLLFTVSILAGPFLLRPRLGGAVGILAFVPRVLGWIGSIAIYIAVSLWLPSRGALHWAGLILFCLVIGSLLVSALRYLLYRPRLRRRIAALERMIAQARQAGQRSAETGAPPDSVLAGQVVAQAGTDPAKAEPILTRHGIGKADQSSIIAFLESRIAPMLRQPVADARREGFFHGRLFSEFSRSFVFSLLVMLWLFVVPMPGLFVFTAGDFRVSFGLWRTVAFILSLIGLGIVGSWVGRLIQWLDGSGLGRVSLKARVQRTFARFQENLRSAAPLPPHDVAAVFALFTDVQTYLDQRSYAYARKLLVAIEDRLSSKR